MVAVYGYSRPQQGIVLLEHSMHAAGTKVPTSSLLKASSSGNSGRSGGRLHSFSAERVFCTPCTPCTPSFCAFCRRDMVKPPVSLSNARECGEQNKQLTSQQVQISSAQFLGESFQKVFQSSLKLQEMFPRLSHESQKNMCLRYQLDNKRTFQDLSIGDIGDVGDI